MGSLRRYLPVVRRAVPVVLASLLVCTALAAWLLSTREEIYSAESQLVVSTSATNGDDLSESYQGRLFSQQRVASYVEIVSSTRLLSAVRTQLGLRDSVRDLQGKVSATAPEGTALLDVTVKDPSARRAKLIADAVARQLPDFVRSLEAPEGGTRSPVSVTITRQAELPGSPASPRRRIYLGAGVLVGLVLGLAAALLQIAGDNRVRSPRQAEELTAAPVLGAVPRDRRTGRDSPLPVSEPSSPRAEAYRRLRTNLRAVPVSEFPTLVVSSALPREGKSRTVANLGLAFAQDGLRVALVDANLRRPGLARLLGLSPAIGLSDVLREDVALDDACQAWGDPPLAVLGAGDPVADPSGLLASPAFELLRDDLRDQADIVLFDTPALLDVADAAIVAGVMSGALLVTRLGSTRAPQLQAAAGSLRMAGSTLLGLVVIGSSAGHLTPVAPFRRSSAPERASRSGSRAAGRDAAPVQATADRGA